LGQVLSAKWPCQWPSPRSASQQDKASPRSASEQDKHILMYLCVNVFTMCSCDVVLLVYLRMDISIIQKHYVAKPCLSAYGYINHHLFKYL